MFESAKRYYVPPFRYDDCGAFITDANGDRILDMRGWGHLTGQGAHGLKHDAATKIQDQTGEDLAKLLTANWPK
jgi:hypothetical protein